MLKKGSSIIGQRHMIWHLNRWNPTKSNISPVDLWPWRKGRTKGSLWTLLIIGLKHTILNLKFCKIHALILTFYTEIMTGSLCRENNSSKAKVMSYTSIIYSIIYSSINLNTPPGGGVLTYIWGTGMCRGQDPQFKPPLPLFKIPISI